MRSSSIRPDPSTRLAALGLLLCALLAAAGLAVVAVDPVDDAARVAARAVPATVRS